MIFGQFGAAKKAELCLARKCALFGVSTSAYYAWKGRKPSHRQLDDMVLLAHIRSQFSLSHEIYGSPRMTVELREDGIAVGRHRVARRIAGWATSDRMKKDLALTALKRALATRQPPPGLIDHSDHGSQYCSGGSNTAPTASA